MRQKVYLYTQTLNGHRSAYLAFCQKILGGQKISRKDLLRVKEPVFFLMIENGFFEFVCAAFVRALMRRKTLGLTFRPKEAMQGQSIRLSLKRAIMARLKLTPLVHIFSIVPTPLEPEIDLITDGWIHDFQLWDMGEAEWELFEKLKSGCIPITHPAMQFYSRIKAEASERPIIVSLGVQNKNKGYEILANTLPSLDAAGWFVVAAGKVAEKQKHISQELISRGMISEDRFLNDDEIIAAYAAADVVWCLYDPTYDQASGILGRAIQFGLPALVRKGSFSEAFCQSEAVPHIAAESSESILEALEKRPSNSSMKGRSFALKLRQQNIARLEEAIWDEIATK
jgi:hypothetical protein